jgi:hypothetical protein
MLATGHTNHISAPSGLQPITSVQEIFLEKKKVHPSIAQKLAYLIAILREFK